jgi:mannobiose 2-epimerase
MSDQLIDAVRQSLWRDVLDRWFPACVSAAGGFHQNIDRAWTRTGGDERFIIFQARTTWVTSQVAAASGGGPYADYARHGLAMLARMVHPRTGTYRWELDAAGRSCGRFANRVHAIGQAFALYALVAAARALDSDEALSAAKRLFGWLEGHQRDRRYGGYFELTNLFGWPLLRSRRLKRHMTGWYKTFNSHLHLFEAFIDLYRLWPDPVLRQRIEELITLFTTRWWREPGRIYGKSERSGRPIPGIDSYGHDVEFAHLLLDAADVLGRAGDPVLVGKAKALLDTALAESWDPQGGFFDPQSQDRSLGEPVKIWWVQAEGLACLAALQAATPDDRYRALLERQWHWITTRQIDPAFGGWFETVAPDGRVVGGDVKAHPWKEIYHEVRAAMVLAKALGSSPEKMLTRP